MGDGIFREHSSLARVARDAMRLRVQCGRPLLREGFSTGHAERSEASPRCGGWCPRTTTRWSVIGRILTWFGMALHRRMIDIDGCVPESPLRIESGKPARRMRMWTTHPSSRRSHGPIPCGIIHQRFGQSCYLASAIIIGPWFRAYAAHQGGTATGGARGRVRPSQGPFFSRRP